MSAWSRIAVVTLVMLPVLCALPARRPPGTAAQPIADGVQLCDDLDYEGVCELFTADNPDLRTSTIGNDRASSIRVAPGWVAAVYEHIDYQGRCETFTAGNPDLRNSLIGNDQISSIRMGDCNLTPPPPPPPPPPAPLAMGVRLCADLDYEGRCETFTADAADLSGTEIGDDQASSIRVAPGWTASVYELPDFGGRCETLNVSNPDLRLSFIGNDSVSAIRVGAACESSAAPPPPRFIQRDFGSIRAGETSCKALDPANSDHVYAFDGVAGQHLSIRMERYGDSPLDSYLYFFGPAGAAMGALMTEDDDSGGGGDAVIVTVLQHMGRHRIVATSRDHASSGAYCLSVTVEG